MTHSDKIRPVFCFFCWSKIRGSITLLDLRSLLRFQLESVLDFTSSFPEEKKKRHSHFTLNLVFIYFHRNFWWPWNIFIFILEMWVSNEIIVHRLCFNYKLLKIAPFQPFFFKSESKSRCRNQRKKHRIFVQLTQFLWKLLVFCPLLTDPRNFFFSFILIFSFIYSEFLSLHFYFK